MSQGINSYPSQRESQLDDIHYVPNSDGYKGDGPSQYDEVDYNNRSYKTIKGVSGEAGSLNETMLVNLTQLEEKDLKIAVGKLKKQNETLRVQLRELSEKLSDVLEKTKVKTKVKEDRPGEFKEDTLIKELENSKQQLSFYKKEMQNLKNRIEVVSGEDRLIKLEVVLKQRDQMIEDLGIETKNLQKINRDQEREISMYHKGLGYEQKVNSANEEIASLREKVRDVQGVSRNNEKNFKKQQEFLTNLNHQYTLVCEKLGIPTNLTFTKVEEVNDYIAKRARGEITQTYIAPPQNQNNSTINASITNNNTYNTDDNTRLREDPERLKKEAYEDQLRELQTNEIILQKQLQSLEKKFQLQQNKIKGDIVTAESDCRGLEAKIRQKESEIMGLDRKVGELKKSNKRSTHALLEPIRSPEPDAYVRGNSRPASDIVQKQSPKRSLEPRKLDSPKTKLPVQQSKTEASPFKKEPEKKTIVAKPQIKEEPKPEPKPEPKAEPKEEPEVREVAGGRIEDGLLEFGDDDIVEDPVTTKIVKVTVWIGDTFLNGIQLSYKINDKEDVIGNQHLAPSMKGKTKIVESLQIDPDDRITLISGKYGQALTSIKFQTAKGKIKDFGDIQSAGEEFEIDMQPGEQPTLLFGAFFKKKDAQNKDEFFLANVGFVLVKKKGALKGK